jgi:DNA-binding Xre family transcriptional regulator
MIKVKVKEVARSRKISMSKLGRMADVDLTTLQKIYRNPTQANITLFTLDKLAKALGVDVRELIESVPDEQD